jgi:hypothetical protein
MATVKVCDECKEQKDHLPFTTTEKDGTVWEACSARCFINHSAKLEATD